MLRLIRKFEGLDYKKEKTILDIEFLEKCLEHNLVPTFVKFKTANRGLQTSVAYRQCQRKLLQQEIVNKRSYLKTVQRQFDNIGKQIRTTVSVLDFAHVSTLFLSKNDRSMDRVRLTQEKKLINLGMATAQVLNDPEKVIFNFSTRSFTDPEKKLLVKGLSLSIPPKRLNYADFLHPFEVLYRKLRSSVAPELSKETVEPVGAAIKDAAFDCLYSYDPKSEQNLSFEEQNALKALLKDDNIIIQKSDKGNSVAILI